MTNHSGTLYVGVTNDLTRRLGEHLTKATAGFTARYRLNRLLYFEETNDVRSAIEREKQIKGWRRSKKFALVRSKNPQLTDLAYRSAAAAGS